MATVDIPVRIKYFDGAPDASGDWTFSGDETALSSIDGDTTKFVAGAVLPGNPGAVLGYFDGPFPRTILSESWVVVARTNGGNVTGLRVNSPPLATFGTIAGTTYTEYVIPSAPAAAAATAGAFFELNRPSDGSVGQLHVTYWALRLEYTPTGHTPAPPAQLSGRVDGLGPLGGPTRLDTAAPSRQSGFHPGGYY